MEVPPLPAPGLPTLFVPHGAPTFAMQPGAAGAALVRLAASLPRPRAILIVSPHWDRETPVVGHAAAPETIHDFRGFPEELYELRYPVPGSPDVAAQVLAELRLAGFPALADPARGLDHGAWVPLRLMFPEGDVPVVPLAIQGQLGPEHHLRLGQALARLARQDVLLIASGNLTHNLRDFQLAYRHGGPAPAYVRAFAEWIWQRLDEGDLAALLDYRRQAPEAVRTHPADDHLLPLFVALGAAGPKARASRQFAGDDIQTIAMDTFAFRPAAELLS